MSFTKLQTIYNKTNMETKKNSECEEITFMDLMRVIASNDTSENQKIALIYLINKIMDLEDELRLIKKKLNEI